MKAGVPQEATAFGLNQLCGSGLRAVALGMQQIASGDAKVIVAGGQESMSQAQHTAHSAQRHEDGRPEVRRHHARATACWTPSTAITWATRRRTSQPSGN